MGYKKAVNNKCPETYMIQMTQDKDQISCVAIQFEGISKEMSSFESHVSNKRCGWGSWHMRLHASKCTECLLNFWESCICLKIKRLKMTLSSQTPLIRKPLRRAYATICTLDRIKENQGILRTSQRVELGATRSNRQGSSPLLLENTTKVSLRNLPNNWVGNHHSHCPWTP